MTRRVDPVTWAVGTVAWVLGMVAVRPLVGSDPLVVVAQTAIDRAPGALATWAIETLGKDAQPALVAGVALATVALGAAVGGVLWYVEPSRPWRRRVRYLTALGVPVVTAWGFYEAGGGLSLRWFVATDLALLGPALLWLRRTDPPAAVGRRSAIEGLGTTAGALAVGAVAARVIGGRRSVSGPRPGEDLDPVAEKTETGTTTPAPTPSTPAADSGVLETRREKRSVVISSAKTDADFGFSFAGMPDRVEGAGDHYVVDKTISTPRVDAGDWTLSVSGVVENPRELAFSELVEHPAARELTVTTVCISNPVGGRLISTVDWWVVPVRTLLEEAGVADEAVDVVTHAEDGYSEALPWSVVRDREDIVLAVGMDGGTLPRKHGFPARLLVPGRYGMKSTKWVNRIQVAAREHDAYWEKRGWDEEAVTNTLSYVRAVQRRGDRVAVGGVAYAGIPGIDRVEVSVDGGDTWTDADLEAPPSDLAWRRWRRVFDRPDSGPMDLVVRATDGNGNTQTSERTNPHPGGSTGWHTITVSL